MRELVFQKKKNHSPMV